MATLLLLAFEVAPPFKDARDPPDQSHEPCGFLEMGQKGREVNRRKAFGARKRRTPDGAGAI